MKKPKLIILEGPDGVGKSTLGKFLANALGGFYFHATATKALIPAMRDYQENLMDNIEDNAAAGRIIVMDRFWPSELIYGAVFRPDNPHGFSFMDIKQRCDKLHALYVVCFSESTLERHAVKKDPKHPYEDQDFVEVVRRYQIFWKNNQLNPDFIRYDMETDGRDMEAFARQLCRTHEELLAQHNFLG